MQGRCAGRGVEGECTYRWVRAASGHSARGRPPGRGAGRARRPLTPVGRTLGAAGHSPGSGDTTLLWGQDKTAQEEVFCWTTCSPEIVWGSAMWLGGQFVLNGQINKCLSTEIGLGSWLHLPRVTLKAALFKNWGGGGCGTVQPQAGDMSQPRGALGNTPVGALVCAMAHGNTSPQNRCCTKLMTGRESRSSVGTPKHQTSTRPSEPPCEE